MICKWGFAKRRMAKHELAPLRFEAAVQYEGLPQPLIVIETAYVEGLRSVGRA